MLSVKYVFHIWQETNGGIVILKSDLWPGSEKCEFNPKFEDNDLKSGCYRVPKLPPLSVNYVCPISHETNHPIMIPKIVLKSVLWRSLESAWYFCIFPLLCFSLHPIAQECFLLAQTKSLISLSLAGQFVLEQSSFCFAFWGVIWRNLLRSLKN